MSQIIFALNHRNVINSLENYKKSKTIFVIKKQIYLSTVLLKPTAWTNILVRRSQRVNNNCSVNVGLDDFMEVPHLERGVIIVD